MGDADKVLDAVSGGPLPVHVLKQRTGVAGAAMSRTLSQLESAGKIVRFDGMVGPPEPVEIPPSSVPPELAVTEEYEPTEEMPSLVGPDVPIVNDPDAPTQVLRQFIVATDYRLLTAMTAQQAADRAMDAPDLDVSEALVVEVEHAQIFERAVVTRPKSL